MLRMNDIRTLTGADFDEIYRAFNEAFSDYIVKMTLSAEQLRELLTRRGWVPHASVAAFDDGRIVAFVLNAVDGERSYNSGTGVVPSQCRCVMTNAPRILRASRT